MNHTTNVVGIYMDHFPDDVRIPDGAFFYLADQAGTPNAALGFMCPCGCRSEGCVTLKTAVNTDRAWTFDGNQEKPTLTPSIKRVGGCKWHGYLTAGEWKPWADSGT